jgi:hypothetical protein
MAAGLSETVLDWTDIAEAMDANAPAKKVLTKRANLYRYLDETKLLATDSAFRVKSDGGS